MKFGTILIFWFIIPSAFSQTVVDNGESTGTHDIVFTEDLTFGSVEEEDVYIWPDPSSKIVPDSRGFMYIVDPQENRIMEFDPNGKFVRIIARPGKGPGELIGIKGFTILADGTALAVDGPIFSDQKIIKFDKGMNFVKEYKQPTVKLVPQTAYFSPNGKYMSTLLINRGSDSEGVVIQNAVVRTRDFHISLNISSVERTSDETLPPSQYWREFILWQLNAVFKGYGVSAFGDDGALYSAKTETYEITKWNQDLSKKSLVIKRRHKPVVRDEEHIAVLIDFFCENLAFSPTLRELFSPAFRRDVLKKADPPPVKNPIFGLIGMEGGRLFVIHDVNYATRIGVADIYSPKGVFMGQVTFQNNALLAQEDNFETRMQFKNGFAYSMTTDENGENKAVRFSYKLTEK